MAPMIHKNMAIKLNPKTKDHRRPNLSIPKRMKMDVATIWGFSKMVISVNDLY